jgi:hypothetical protein
MLAGKLAIAGQTGSPATLSVSTGLLVCIRFAGGRRLGRIGLELFKLQFRLIEQFAAALR